MWPLLHTVYHIARPSTRQRLPEVSQPYLLPVEETNANEILPDMSIYQSNSLCYNYCNGVTDLQKTEYALAVVSYQGCWCTNYAPDSTTTGCDEPCPGWQPELCGSSSPVLYGYIQLPQAISGTRGASSATTSTSASQVRSPVEICRFPFYILAGFCAFSGQCNDYVSGRQR